MAHQHRGEEGDKLGLAICINMGLTLVQFVGGLAAGSLALVADALHNFSDAISLVIAYVARRIGRRPADAKMTFGYVRAEYIAALINYTTLVIIAVFLIYESILRFYSPSPVAGWIVVIIAGIALAIDLVTALLTYRMAKSSVNIRAAFLHNVSDAMSSVVVMIAGSLIILFNWTWIDPALTLAIAVFILYQVYMEIGQVIRLLMLASPDEAKTEEIVQRLKALPDVKDVHMVRFYPLDEHHSAFEAHVVALDTQDQFAKLHNNILNIMEKEFAIDRLTLSIEPASAACQSAPLFGYRA